VAHYCIRCGSELQTKVIEGREVEACSKDDFVLWRDPKVTSAVVVEVDGGVVLGRRAIEPAYGEWCLPGGFVNHDEHPADAAVRECIEEVGAAVELTSLLGVYHVPKGDAPSMIGIAYGARLAYGAKLSPGPEMLEVAVFPLDSLPKLAFPSHRHVIDMYVKSRESVVEASPLRAAATAQLEKLPSQAPGRSRPPRTP
jgi:ADP-ribose pyrophosphatase YjhB (NUDIX family)